jgi:hypothetical protein
MFFKNYINKLKYKINMSKGEIVHATYLHNWMKPVNYRKAGIEDLESIVSVIPEPIWYIDNKYIQHKLCDYIIILNDKTALSAELKGSYSQKHKAVEQIRAGQEFIENILNMEYRYGIFIVYNNYGYDHYKINKR